MGLGLGLGLVSAAELRSEAGLRGAQLQLRGHGMPSRRISPHISPHLPVSPCISLGALLRLRDYGLLRLREMPSTSGETRELVEVRAAVRVRVRVRVRVLVRVADLLRLSASTRC